MKRMLLLGLALLSVSTAAQAHTRTWITPDFFVDTPRPGEGPRSSYRPRARPTDCRANIAAIMCVGTDHDFDVNTSTSSTSGCDDTDAQTYVDFFEAVYDRLPPIMQQMFCSVEILRVQPGLESIAYAGMRYHGAEVGFRKSVIDENLDLTTLMSWKEQLPFGGVRGRYAPVATLPNINVQSGYPAAQDLAFYVLTHEFGHLFDFANSLNRIAFGGAAPNSWTSLSWTSAHTVRRDQDFPSRAKVCYYDCAGRPLSRKAIAPLYKGLDDSNFITLYASTNIYDDFADSLAMTLMAQDSTSSYVLTDGQGNAYDAHVKLRSTQFARKAAYIAKFLERTDLRYP